MSLSWVLTLLLVVALILASGFLFALAKFMEVHIAGLVSPDIAATILPPLHFLLVEQAVIIYALGIAAAVIFFIILNAYFISPLQKIVRIINTFALENTRLDLPSFKNAPKEIRELARSFSSFADKVESAHQKDTETSRVKSDFISTAAHQLRTPLTGIRWALEALEKERLTATQEALVKNAIEKSHDLVAIVGTLLDISSIESGKYKYNFEITTLEPTIEGIVQDFGELARTSQISLYYAKGESPLPNVRVDRERIKWVLNNIIENAIRYTPAGGTVDVKTEVVANRIFVRIHDTGIGIPSTDRSNIFQRFYRASNAVTKQNQGNGLGLYIARTIATDHGGDLDFESNAEGPGTTFVLSLPVAA